MTHLPRLAVGTIQPGIDPAPITWALANLFQRHGQQVQVFHDQARFSASDAGRVICGQGVRYLDSWLMSPALAAESFRFGASSSDLSLISGQYDHHVGREGSLANLSCWLSLPKLVILDVPTLADCQLPRLPTHASGILLDRVAADDFVHWQTILETLYRVPVVGGLAETTIARKYVHQPVSVGGPAPCEICNALGNSLARTASMKRLFGWADSTPAIETDSHVYSPSSHLSGLHVAVAFDESINGYFPDVLDLLELHGATVTLFSPLRDEKLPDDVDIVYFGCGRPDLYSAALAGNCCMTMALRQHAHLGKRIFAESGGLAYLAQHIKLPSGKVAPMAGVMPIAAHALAVDSNSLDVARPMEVTFARDHWLGERGEPLRGYNSQRWEFSAFSSLEPLASEPGKELALVSKGSVIGTQLHVNFAAQPHFARRFAPPLPVRSAIE